MYICIVNLTLSRGVIGSTSDFESGSSGSYPGETTMNLFASRFITNKCIKYTKRW